MGDDVLGSMRLSADCLYDEIAWKKYKRETIDDRHGIGHCGFKLCQECFADRAAAASSRQGGLLRGICAGNQLWFDADGTGSRSWRLVVLGGPTVTVTVTTVPPNTARPGNGDKLTTVFRGGCSQN